MLRISSLHMFRDDCAAINPSLEHLQQKIPFFNLKCSETQKCRDSSPIKLHFVGFCEGNCLSPLLRMRFFGKFG
ncbi:hypothetical protein KFK09_007514 [Dendrobium nobile]|uniref:Uncharacterized protein n=1 Tax=Dendrobium nobile TaxID=94219 RepID=A0A8T3BUJ8_DENNO|nr:hypothetical protein KFK09_007514 [Dendrobium nobile]